MPAPLRSHAQEATQTRSGEPMLQKAALNVPATQTQGSPTLVENLTAKYVQVTGIAGGCVVRIQGSLDGTNFFNIGAADINADGLQALPETVSHVRVDRKTVGTGTPSVVIGGLR
jgi:hypothetical protein